MKRFAFIPILLILTLTLALAVSCGKEATEAPDTCYRVSEYPLPERFSPSGNIEVTDNRIYIPGTQTAPILLADDVEQVYSLDTNGENPLAEPYERKTSGYLSSVLHSNDGEYNVELTNLDSGGRTAAIISDSGEVYDCSELFGTDLSKIRNVIHADNGFRIHSVKFGNDKLIVAANIGAAMIDTKTGVISTLRSERALLGAEVIAPDQPSDTGKVIALMVGEKEIPTAVVELDLLLGTTTVLSAVPELALNQIIKCAFLHDNLLHYVTATGIYSIDADGKTSQVVGFMDSGIGNGVMKAASLGEDEFIITERDSILDTYRVLRLSPIPESERVEKIPITVGYTLGDLKMLNAAAMFNRQNESYRIELVALGTDENPYGDEVKLAADFAAGNMPDIVCFSGGKSEFRMKLAHQGALYDLYRLIDADDDFDRDMLLDCARASGEYDGKLTSIPIRASISTCIAAADTFEDGRLTLDAVMDKLEAGQTDLFCGTQFGGLRELLQYDILSFVDPKSGTTEFDGERFVRLAELYKHLYNLPRDRTQSVTKKITGIREGKFKIFTDCSVWQLDTIELDAGDGAQNCGWADSNGSGYIYSSQGEYAISSCCKHPEAAWEFIKLRISDMYYESDSTELVLVTKDAFERYLTERKSKYIYYSYDRASSSQSTIPFTDEQLKRLGAGEYLDPAIEEKYLREAVAGARCATLLESDLLAIVNEELWAFAESDHLTAEEVCEIINDRAGKLYSERS